jgi:hypothetical protein
MGGIYDHVDSWVIALLMAAGMFAAWRIGWRRGRARRDAGRPSSAGRLEDSSIALLGLLLAFTFSMAIDKHNRRREMVVADSNAIGDFYTCVTLQAEPVRSRLQEILREYTRLRLELAQRPPAAGAIERDLARFEQMHGQMTDLVGQALAQGTPIAAPLTNTLNDLTSSYASRLAAVSDRLPVTIVVLLLFAGVMAAYLAGRHQGGSSEERPSGALTFILLVTLVVWVTLDLNQPYRGVIRISQLPMQRLYAAMTP